MSAGHATDYAAQRLSGDSKYERNAMIRGSDFAEPALGIERARTGRRIVRIETNRVGRPFPGRRPCLLEQPPADTCRWRRGSTAMSERYSGRLPLAKYPARWPTVSSWPGEAFRQYPCHFWRSARTTS